MQQRSKMHLIQWSLLVHLACYHNAFCQHISRNSTTLLGQPVLLNCTVIPVHAGQSLTLIWLRPSDGLPVSIDFTVASEHANRLQVVGDRRMGQYHLLIRYAIYPQDAGTWTCTSLSEHHRVLQQTTLLVLVPPAAQMPAVTPDSIDILSALNTQYTFTCVSHYAFPPVNLTWIKEHGPEVSYTVSPPRVLMSRAHTYSMSIVLVVRAVNANSLFSCLASHPTFMGYIRRQSARFMLASNEVLPQSQGQVSKAHLVADKVTASSTSKIRMDSIDRTFLLLAIAIVASCFIFGVLLSKFKSRWRLATAQRSQCSCQMLAYLTLAVLLLSSLLFAVPFYLKGITIPSVDSDEMTCVFAGGSLWLDCSELTQPVDSLVQVTWHRSNELLYHQYYLNGQVISYPPNTTAGIMFHVRAMSATIGQVMLYPVAPGDDGIYSCHIVTISGTDVTQNSERHKTITVYVLMGPLVNYALLVCLSIAVLSSAFIVSLTLHRVVECHCHRPSGARMPDCDTNLTDRSSAVFKPLKQNDDKIHSVVDSLVAVQGPRHTA
jgi:hypothetical protein